MKNKISAVIAILFFFFMSKSCISDYVSANEVHDDNSRSIYEEMVSDGSFVTGELEPRYTARTMKILGVPMTFYDFNYNYTVNGEAYSGKHTFKEVLPKEASVKVYYLKGNPSLSSLDPQEKINEAKESRERKKSRSNLYWGIAFGALCFFSVIGFIQDLKKKEVPKEEKRDDEGPNNFMGY